MGTTELVAEIKEAFKYIPDNVQKFDKLHSECAAGDLVAYKVNEKKGNVMLVRRELGQMSGMMSPKNTYTIYRFFPLGDNWHVSIDAQDVSPEKMAQRLLEY